MVLVILIIVGAIALSRVFVNSRTLPQVSVQLVRIPVTVVELSSGAHPVEVSTTGRVIPRSTVSITPQVTGRVEWISEQLHSGGYLTKHETLFRIESADYDNDLAKESAAVAKADTDLALERAEANAAVAEWQALNEALEPPPLVSRQPQIAQKKAELAAAKARYAQAELNLSRTQYQLPFDGRVISSSLELGEYVLAGQSYGEIFNQDSLEIVVSLSQQDLQWVSKPEQVSVSITFEQPVGEQSAGSIEGEILRIGATLDATTRFQELIIKPIGDGSLLPGMLTEVTLGGVPVAKTWRLPSAALQPGQIIWVVDEEARLRRIEPEIIAVLSDSVLARLPVDAERVRVVNSMISGAIEGAEVMVLGDAEGLAP